MRLLAFLRWYSQLLQCLPYRVHVRLWFEDDEVPHGRMILRKPPVIVTTDTGSQILCLEVNGEDGYEFDTTPVSLEDLIFMAYIGEDP